MTFSLPFLRSITRYLGSESYKVLFLTKKTLQFSKNDLFIWTNIYGPFESFKEAAYLGHLRWVKHLFYYGYHPEEKIFEDNLAWYGHLEIIKWIHYNTDLQYKNLKFIGHEHPADTALCKNNWDVFLFYYYIKKEISKIGKSKPILSAKRLHYKLNLGYHFEPRLRNLKKTSLIYYKWLSRIVNNPLTELMDESCYWGQIDITKWCHYNGKDCTTNAMRNAALEQHFSQFKFLHHNRNEGFKIRFDDDYSDLISIENFEIFKFMCYNLDHQTIELNDIIEYSFFTDIDVVMFLTEIVKDPYILEKGICKFQESEINLYIESKINLYIESKLSRFQKFKRSLTKSLSQIQTK